MPETFEPLQALTEAIGTAVDADAAIVRFLDDDQGQFVARAVWALSPILSAELVGSRRDPEGEAGDAAVLRFPVVENGDVVAELELRRQRGPFSPEESRLAEAAAAQVGILLRLVEPADGGDGLAAVRGEMVRLAGDSLAVAAGGAGAADQLARLAAETAAASAALLWRVRSDGRLELVAVHSPIESPNVSALAEAAAEAVEGHAAASAQGRVVSLRLGEPPLGALQLVFDGDSPVSEGELSLLSTFAVRAAHALRSIDALEEKTTELERTRALLTVVGQAIAQLSLAHTLEIAIDRIAELIGVEKVAVYLREAGRLQPVAGRGLVGPHAGVGERLLTLALGPFRGRGPLSVADARRAETLAQVRDELAESGIEAALAVPLLAHEEVIGLLAVYPPRNRRIGENESALVAALAAQLAVVVENARLHDEAKRLGSELEGALVSERQAAEQLRALYEISRSFTHSLSLESTLTAVTRTVVESLGIDAAAIRTPDPRGEVLETRSVHLSDRQPEAFRTILSEPQPISRPPVRRLLRTREPLFLDRRTAASLPGHELLVPFLERGATGVVVPVATPGEALATLTLLSLDPARPIRGEIVDVALSIAAQAALVIDNARLYQQQKGFADMMQRSLLPRSEPKLEGLELGAVYESSARVDVGGDVYDFLSLPDGRLAVVLGDVTGHGIEAAADMAMAKFVFRSLTREHPEPGDFLASANEVVTGEIAVGKFVTLAYVVVDAKDGEVGCASAGHPAPRLVRPDGTVSELSTTGLPLGVESGEEYEELRVPFEPGAVLVLYTDGVVEPRRGNEQYGVDRLDEVLAEGRGLGAKQLAGAIIADCRAYSGGDLADDCAIVVIKREVAG